MKACERLALVFVGFFAMSLLGVIFGVASQATLAPVNPILIGANCVGLIVFAVLTVKYVIESCRTAKV